MNSEELQKALDEAGVDRRIYHFPGKISDGPQNDGGVYLRQEADRWVVGYWERGQSSEQGSYESEEEAQRVFYGILTWKVPEPIRETPEEAEASRLHNARRLAELERDTAERKARYDAEQAAKGES